jgi:hypothetical protein
MRQFKQLMLDHWIVGLLRQLSIFLGLPLEDNRRNPCHSLNIRKSVEGKKDGSGHRIKLTLANG